MEVLLAHVSKFSGLHGQDLVITRGVLGVHKRVMVWQIDLAVEKVGVGGEGLGNVGKHVCHGLVDAGPVQVAIDPLAALCKGREVKGFDGAVPDKVGKFCVVAELFIQQNILGWEIASHGVQLVHNDWRLCSNAIKLKAINVVG